MPPVLRTLAIAIATAALVTGAAATPALALPNDQVTDQTRGDAHITTDDAEMDPVYGPGSGVRQDRANRLLDGHVTIPEPR